jgi:23S rRNA pseudouridine1911/1915/1917 synthase
MAVTVLFEDNHLLAVMKPAGLLVQGDRSGDATLLDWAKGYLKEKYAKPGNVYVGLVHRLDRNVSGVVLLARTSKAASRLSACFRENTVTKTYLAVVHGVPASERGELVSWLGSAGDRHGVTRAERAAFPGGRESVLRYRRLAAAGSRSLLEIQPVTGRRHQIRAQLALIGHPLLGDVKYGATERLAARRIALHAGKLEVAHPVGNRLMVLEAPVPPDWPWPDSAPKESAR